MDLLIPFNIIDAPPIQVFLFRYRKCLKQTVNSSFYFKYSDPDIFQNQQNRLEYEGAKGSHSVQKLQEEFHLSIFYRQQGRQKTPNIVSSSHIFLDQEADIDPESLLLPLSKRRRSRRVSTVDGLRPDGGGGYLTPGDGSNLTGRKNSLLPGGDRSRRSSLLPPGQRSRQLSIELYHIRSA